MSLHLRAPMAKPRSGKWWPLGGQRDDGPDDDSRDPPVSPPAPRKEVAETGARLLTDGIEPPTAPELPPVFTETAMQRAAQALLEQQRDDGHWIFELEADATIPAEYVLLTHYLGEPDTHLERRIAVYLRRVRTPGGGWALNHEGIFDVSASVKAYMALKAIGDPVSAAHMVEARQAIISAGGAEQANVFTRFLLALFGELPWSSVPVTPVEIMFMPRLFPIHLSRISYWGRTVLVPLLVLYALKPLARNPRRVAVDELFVRKPGHVKPSRRADHQSLVLFAMFAFGDALMRRIERFLPRTLRRRAIDKAVAFVHERLNGDCGLGAIFPAMAFAVMMFDALGYSRDHPDYVSARKAVDGLLVLREDEAYCQPCTSPVWDTALAAHAMLEVGTPEMVRSAERGLRWLKLRQVLDLRGDWAVRRPDVRPGGWAFQYENPHYPDLDDTAAVVLAMDRFRGMGLDAQRGEEFTEAIERGKEWIVGLQSRGGGWGAFDADNTQDFLNHMPFADHGALLDPPTADVTARCVGALAQMGQPTDGEALRRGLAYLHREQRADGSWYGRWGINHIYGTWSVLCALHGAGVPKEAVEIRRASAWLVSIQHPDGGWGEHERSYALDVDGFQPAPSTASQTAWALLGLLAAGEVRHTGVRRGIEYLVRNQQPDGFWNEPEFTATGFPRVFYLRYHGYSKFFPLWALARYRRLMTSPGADDRFGL